MPILTCPKCASKLRLPEGAKGNARCPKCQTTITIGSSPPPAPPPPAKPAFEVVEDAPAPPPRPAPKSATATPRVSGSSAKHKPVPREEPLEVTEELEELPPLRSRRGEGYDDRDRRRSRDDEDYGRGPRRRRDEFDDDYDDFDDYPERRGNPFKQAQIGLLLLSISMWLYLATFCVITLSFILVWSGSESYAGFLKLAGVLGLGNLILCLVGLGFCIAGPTKYGARGLAIAATVVSVFQLVFTFITANKPMFGVLGSFDSDGFRSRSDFHIEVFSSLWVIVDVFLVFLVYASKMASEIILPFFGGLCDIARLILIMFVAKAISRAAKDRSAAGQARTGMMGISIVAGAIPLVVILLAVILDASRSKTSSPSAGRGMGDVAAIFVLFLLLAHTAALVFPAIALQSARSAAARMARRR